MHFSNGMVVMALAGTLAGLVCAPALAGEMKSGKMASETDARLVGQVTKLPNKEVLQCPAPGILKSMGDRSNAPTVVGDRSCFVEWHRAAELMQSKTTTTVDVRPSAAYSQIHLPDAINVELELVKTKSFLAAKPLLIYGDGKDDRRLEVLCSDLKSRGFAQVKIISGGIVAWARASGAEAGVDLLRLAEFSAEDLYVALQSEDSLFVKVSRQFSSPEIDPYAASLEGPLSPENVASALDRAKAKNSSFRRVVLVGVNRASSKILTEILVSPKIRGPVFYYPGDQKTFETALQNMRALWAKKQKGSVTSRCSFS